MRREVRRGKERCVMGMRGVEVRRGKERCVEVRKGMERYGLGGEERREEV